MDSDPYPGVTAGLDQRRTMDFVLLGYLSKGFTLPSVNFESMKSRVTKLIEEQDFEELPPLEVIFYDDLVHTAWGWKRLLPWRIGFLLFEDYFGYLERYYRINKARVHELLNVSVDNGSASLNAAAAKECMDTLKTLDARIGHHAGLTGIKLHNELSHKIVEQACAYNNPDATPAIPAGSIVPATCFMCITEEARFKLSEMSDMNGDDVELSRVKLEFGNMVRQVAFDILIKYRGHHSEQVSAAMLGMASEYSHARGLLEQDGKQDVEYFDELCESSQVIRRLLLELLFIIRDKFPSQSAIDYDSIEHFRTARKNAHTKHLSAPKETVSANMVSPANFDENAIPKTSTPLRWCMMSIINIILFFLLHLLCGFKVVFLLACCSLCVGSDQNLELESLCQNSTDITGANIPETTTPTKIASPATPSSFARSVNNYPFDQSSNNYKKRSIEVSQVSGSELPSTQPSEQSNDSGTAAL